MQNDVIYENGEAEAMLLKTLLPSALVMAVAVVAYNVGGMPWVSATFAQVIKPIVNAMSVAAPVTCALMWFSTRDVSNPVRVHPGWVATQLALAAVAFAGVMGTAAWLLGQ